MIPLEIDGIGHSVHAVDDMPLLWALRDLPDLGGTEFGCEASLCGPRGSSGGSRPGTRRQLVARVAEDITLEDGRVGQSDFDDHRVLRMAETPRIDMRLLQSGRGFGGVGEAGLSATPPAVSNAMFAATGKRLRSLPLKGIS